MANNPLQTEAITRNEPYRKDAQAFAQGEGPCYWADGASYTCTDFIQIANGEVAIAEQLFSLIDGQAPQKGLYKLVDEGILRVPDYISDEGKRTILSFQGPPLPTVSHQQLLKTHGWEALFPELAHPRLWTRQVPDAPVPHGIAFTDLVKRSELDMNESSEGGHDHE
jgi:hypothetical protein